MDDIRFYNRTILGSGIEHICSMYEGRVIGISMYMKNRSSPGFGYQTGIFDGIGFGYGKCAAPWYTKGEPASSLLIRPLEATIEAIVEDVHG